MTPTLPEILRGNALALAGAAEGGVEFGAATVGAVALLNLLAAQEAEDGEAAMRAQNEAIAALLADAAREGYAVEVAPAEDGGWRVRDARNAALRRELIALHEAVEARGDGAWDARVLAFYRQMAGGRLLVLPPLPGA